MDELEEQPGDYFRVPRPRAVRKVLMQLLLMRLTRALAMINTRAVVEVAESMASRGRSGWVSTRDGEWTLVLNSDSSVSREPSYGEHMSFPIREIPTS